VLRKEPGRAHSIRGFCILGSRSGEGAPDHGRENRPRSNVVWQILFCSLHHRAPSRARCGVQNWEHLPAAERGRMVQGRAQSWHSPHRFLKHGFLPRSCTSPRVLSTCGLLRLCPEGLWPEGGPRMAHKAWQMGGQVHLSGHPAASTAHALAC